MIGLMALTHLLNPRQDPSAGTLERFAEIPDFVEGLWGHVTAFTNKTAKAHACQILAILCFDAKQLSIKSNDFGVVLALACTDLCRKLFKQLR